MGRHRGGRSRVMRRHGGVACAVGLFVSTLLVGLARLLYWFFSGVAGDLFGRRKF